MTAKGNVSKRLCSLSICLLACGCGESNAQIGITIPDGDEIVFLLQLDSDGQILELGAPLAPASAMPEFAEAASDSELLMLALSESDLSGAVVSYDRSRWSRLQLQPRAPDGPVDPRSDPAIIAVPSGAHLYEVDLDTEQLQPAELDAYPSVAGLGISVPTDEAFCRHLQPSQPRVLETDFSAVSNTILTRLAALGDGRFLGLASNSVYVIDPRDGSASGLDISEIDSRSMARISGIAVQPLDQVSGPREIWAVGSVQQRSMAWRLTLAADGLRFAETATLTGENLGHLKDALFDDRGGLIFVGEPDTAFVRRPGMEAFEAVNLSVPANKTEKVERLISTGMADFPHLIAGSLDTVLMGDVLTGMIRASELRVNSGLGSGGALPRVIALAAEPGKQLWAAGRLALFSHYTHETGWRDVHPDLPHTVDPCTEGRSFDEIAAKTLEMVYANNRVYFLIDECPMLFVLDLDAECTAALELPGLPIRREMMFSGGGLLAEGNQLVISAMNGTLFVLDL